MKDRTRLAPLALSIPLAFLAGAALLQEGGDELRSADETFTYFGELLWLNEPYTGTADFRFTLWDQATGGAQIAVEQLREDVVVIDGMFQTKLSFAEGPVTDGSLWLEVAVRAPAGEGEFTTLSPRQSIRPMGHELREDKDDAAGGEHSDDAREVKPQDDPRRKSSLGPVNDANRGAAPDHGSAAGAVRDVSTLRPENPDEQRIRILSPSPWIADGNGIHYDAGHVGVGANSHGNFTLSVKTGPGDRAAIFSRTDEPSGWGYYSRATGPSGRGIFGTATSSTGENFGVYGVSFSDEGRGVFGWAKSATGENYGVYGQSDSTSGFGVFGWASANSGITYGVAGSSHSSEGVGVYGLASALTGATSGAYGRSHSALGRGVYGEATATIGVNYGVYGQSNSTNGFDFYAGGAGTNYGAASSIRWKRNIEAIDEPLYKLAQLRGVYFDWDDEHGGHHDIGMIAEEVGKVLPEIVNYEENGIDAIGMDYSKLTPLLVEAVKALDEENNELRERVAALEALVAQLAPEQEGGEF